MLARAALRVCARSVPRTAFGILARNKLLNTNVLCNTALVSQRPIAHKCVSTQVDRDGDAVTKRLDNAQLMLKIEKFDKARALFDDIVREFPNDVRGYGGRADAYQFLKQYDNAIADYKQVIRFAPKCVPALHNIALCHARLKKYSDALKDLNYLIAMDAKYMPAYGTRADIYEVCGDSDKAADDYMTIIQFDPSNVDALMGLGKLAMRRKDFDDAKEIYTRVLNLDPNTPSVASRLGRLEYETQVREGKPFHENHPHIEAHRALAIIAYHNSDWTEIIPNLNKAKDLELEAETYKPDVTSHVMRGAALFHAKEYKNAFGSLDKALKMEPNNAAALFLRAGVHFHNQDYDWAMDDYQHYLKVLNDDPKGAADELQEDQILLVLERIARTGRLQFMRGNRLLRRIPVKVDDTPGKPKLVYQDSAAPRDPIQALFVGVAQEEVEGSEESKRGKPRKPDIVMRFYEGEEVEYDEALEHIGRMQPDAREEEKKRVFPEVKKLMSFIKQEKYDPTLAGVDFFYQSLEAILKLQEGIDHLPPLMQESCLLNINQVLDCGKKYVIKEQQKQ